MAHLASAFAQAAYRAKKAGFDAVQIHAAHGYLLSQFLSPAFNKRTGRIWRRTQEPGAAFLKVVQSIRKTVGPEYPVLIKINSEDFLDGA